MECSYLDAVALVHYSFSHDPADAASNISPSLPLGLGRYGETGSSIHTPLKAIHWHKHIRLHCPFRLVTSLNDAHKSAFKRKQSIIHSFLQIFCILTCYNDWTVRSFHHTHFLTLKTAINKFIGDFNRHATRSVKQLRPPASQNIHDPTLPNPGRGV